MGNQKALTSYVAWLQHLLNLDEWVIRISEVSTSDPDSAAEIASIDGRKVADVHLAPGFVDDNDPTDIRHYLIHELLHLHHEEVSQVVDQLGVCLSIHEHKLAANLHHHACEIMVDQLAYAWERHLQATKADAKRLAKVKA